MHRPKIPRMSTPKNKPSKADHVFPAPEWTSLSASLAASLAHEIRNPLLAIKGAAQLLAQVTNADDHPLTQLIISEAARIEQLIAQLDPLTPNPGPVSERVNIHEITEYVRLAASSFAGDIAILTEYDPSLPEIAVMRPAMIQALMNLVKNAVEAVAEEVASGQSLESSKEGVVSNEDATSTPRPSITLATRYLVGERMRRIGGKKLPIELSVTDTGPGVAADVIGRLFTPFSSTKENGKGLGLAIVAKIIEEHGGLIAYAAPPTGGARFSIYLPVA